MFRSRHQLQQLYQRESPLENPIPTMPFASFRKIFAILIVFTPYSNSPTNTAAQRRCLRKTSSCPAERQHGVSLDRRKPFFSLSCFIPTGNEVQANMTSEEDVAEITYVGN